MGTTTATGGPWKQLLLNALQSNSNHNCSSYFQLATIGSNGRPSNRTVVFRGFQDNSDKIQISTDSRTHKVEDLKHCPFAEFRINGRVDIIDGSNADPIKLEQRERGWFGSSLKSRMQYLGPHPGLSSEQTSKEEEASLDPSTGPVSTYCLLVLDSEQVDYLNLKNNERVAFVSTRQSVDGEKFWTSQRVNP